MRYTWLSTKVTGYLGIARYLKYKRVYVFGTWLSTEVMGRVGTAR